MKYLLLILIFVVGCDFFGKENPKVYRSSHTETPTGCPPCPSCDEFVPPADSILEITLPPYMAVMVDQKYFSVVSALLDAAVADEKDIVLQDNLWNYLGKLYPEVKTGVWTLYRNGEILYIIRPENK